MTSPASTASPALVQPTGIALLLWASEPEAPQRLVTPFFHAAAAAALDYQTEVYFAARSVLLLERGVASALHASSHPSSVYDAMRDAVGHGAVFYACSDALQAQGLAWPALIPEVRQRGGAVQFISRVADPRWRTLVF